MPNGRRAFRLRFGEDVRIGRFAGFDLLIRSSFNNTAKVVLRGKTVTSAAFLTRPWAPSVRWNPEVQGFEERAARLETDIKDSQNRAITVQNMSRKKMLGGTSSMTYQPGHQWVFNVSFHDNSSFHFLRNYRPVKATATFALVAVESRKLSVELVPTKFVSPTQFTRSVET